MIILSLRIFLKKERNGVSLWKVIYFQKLITSMLIPILNVLFEQCLGEFDSNFHKKCVTCS
jgi:hypothetical protein